MTFCKLHEYYEEPESFMGEGSFFIVFLSCYDGSIVPNNVCKITVKKKKRLFSYCFGMIRLVSLIGKKNRSFIILLFGQRESTGFRKA